MGEVQTQSQAATCRGTRCRRNNPEIPPTPLLNHKLEEAYQLSGVHHFLEYDKFPDSFGGLILLERSMTSHEGFEVQNF